MSYAKKLHRLSSGIGVFFRKTDSMLSDLMDSIYSNYNLRRALRVGVVSLCIFGAIGCEKDSDSSVQLKKKFGKPLPDECLTNVTVSLIWDKDWRALNYKIMFVHHNPYYHISERTVGGESTGVDLLIPRNGEYGVQVIRTFRDGNFSIVNKDLFGPSCEDRDEWRKSNPDYEEPQAFKLYWSNL